jgi:phage gpG-like protein
LADITVDVDADRAIAQLRDLAARLHDAGHTIARKGAEKIQDHAREILDSGAHSPGSRALRPAPAAPGTISGHLAEGVWVRSTGDGAEVGPTADYGRFLELGGTHVAHSPSGMRWSEDGQSHRADVLRKGPRPYMKPAREASLAEIHDIAVREIGDAIRGALG